MDDEGFREARETAVRLLSRREHSRSELCYKLLRRDWPDDIVQAVLDDLSARNYLSDARYVESFLRERIARGQGPLKIVAGLRERGIGPEVYGPLMDALDVDWMALAREARERRFGAAAPADRREWGRQGRFLAGRGFTTEQIARVLGETE